MSTGDRSWRLRDVLARAENRSPPALLRFVGRLLREFQRLEPFDRAMTLAAQAFTSIFPLVIAAASVLNRPDARGFSQHLADALALPESTEGSLASMLPSDSEVSATFGVLGLLIVLLSATSFSRALTRMYAKAWTVRPPGWAGGWRWIAAIVAIAGATVGLQTVDAALGDASSGVVGVLLLTWLVHSFLWTWVPWLLLGARVPWLLLAPGGVMMGVAAVVMSVVGRIYLPPALEHASDRFGDLGVAFAYIGWLFAFAFVLIVATLLGMVLARAPGPFSRMLERRTGPWSEDPEPVGGSLIPYE